MNEPKATTRIGLMLLGRVLVAEGRGATITDLRKAIEPLAGHRLDGAALGECIAQTLAELLSLGLIKRPLIVKKVDRFHITDFGRESVLAGLGVERLPPKTSWQKLKKDYLAVIALGMPAPNIPAATKAFRSDSGFNAVLLKLKYDLPLGDYPTFTEAINALCWTLLGFPSERLFTTDAAKTALIRRELGDDKELEAKPNPHKEAVKLLAKLLGVTDTSKDAIRVSAIRRWVEAELGTPVAEPKTVSPSAPASTLEAFARRVLEAGRSSRSGRFGSNKVFVVHVWELLQDDPEFAAMGFEGFKKRLAEANNARLLDLSRADLVEAMDPADVLRSEVSYLGAKFHFIRV